MNASEGSVRGADAIRVMRVISRMNIGGPSTHVVLLNAGLNAEGYDCLLVCGSEGTSEGSLRDVAEAKHLRIATIPELGREIAPLRDVLTVIKLYRLMRRERPHIVHTHLAKAGFVGRLAARLAGVPIVLHTFHGHVFHGYFSARKTKVFATLERLSARLSTRIITISPRLREEIAAAGVTSIDRISVIPLGLELGTLLASPRRDGAFRKSIGISERAKLVGAVGRLVAIKNIALLLEATALSQRGEPDMHLVLVGDGELRADLEGRVRALGLSERVTFAGWRRDLASVYADLDAIIISSDNEGTPASLIEAMAAGCPVIATRVGGVPDLVEDGVTGRLTPPAESRALAAAMLELFRQPEQTRQMADQAREHVSARHQANRLITDMDRLYQELLQEGGMLRTGTLESENRANRA